MKIPPWLKMRSTGAEVAGTQYIELTNGRRHFKLIIVNDGREGSSYWRLGSQMYACSVQRRDTGWATNAEAVFVV